MLVEDLNLLIVICEHFHSSLPALITFLYSLPFCFVLIPSSGVFAQKLSHTRMRVVNVSSLLAVKAFSGWSVYATVKAARDMFTSVLALEVRSNC
jgi:NAD(P)-dependent dehydrogenase (short-subunit alcohol dehydrogenase family)